MDELCLRYKGMLLSIIIKYYNELNIEICDTHRVHLYQTLDIFHTIFLHIRILRVDHTTYR